MSEYTIVLCRLCGVKMRRYSMCVYPGDSTCCAKCNEESKDPEKVRPSPRLDYSIDFEW